MDEFFEIALELAWVARQIDSMRCHLPDREASVKTMHIRQYFLDFYCPEPVVRVEGWERAGKVSEMLKHDSAGFTKEAFVTAEMVERGADPRVHPLGWVSSGWTGVAEGSFTRQPSQEMERGPSDGKAGRRRVLGDRLPQEFLNLNGLGRLIGLPDLVQMG